MTYISQAELSRLVGVSRAAIADAIKKDTIPFVVVDGKRKINLDNPAIQHYLSGNRQRSQVHHGVVEQVKAVPKKKRETVKKKTIKKKPVVKKEVKKPVKSNAEKNREIPTENPELILEGIPDDLKLMTKHDLDRMKSAMKVMQDQLKHETDRGFYIDKNIVKKTFHALYRIDTEEFLQLPATLSARICQDVFGINEPELMTKTSEVLNNEFYKIQNHIRVTLNRDLGDMGIEGVG